MKGLTWLQLSTTHEASRSQIGKTEACHWN